jgi:hypothetical protein
MALVHNHHEWWVLVFVIIFFTKDTLIGTLWVLYYNLLFVLIVFPPLLLSLYLFIFCSLCPSKCLAQPLIFCIDDIYYLFGTFYYSICRTSTT